MRGCEWRIRKNQTKTHKKRKKEPPKPGNTQTPEDMENHVPDELGNILEAYTDAEEEAEKQSRKNHIPDTLERQIEEWVGKEEIELREETKKSETKERDEEEERGERTKGTCQQKMWERRMGKKNMEGETKQETQRIL